MMKKTINLCTRVEGHGKLRYVMKKKQLHGVNFEVQGIRGFENILKRKKLLDVPKLTGRICGLCHVSQTLASCKAIEDMYEITPSDQVKHVRKLMMIGDQIKSHVTHFFFQAFPDLFSILESDKKVMNPHKLVNFDAQLSSNMFELVKNGMLISTILGGRALHPITPAIGGSYYTPVKKDIDNVKKCYQKSLDNLKFSLDKFIDLFSAKSPPREYSLEGYNFMSMQDNSKFNIYEGELKIKLHDDITFDVPIDKTSEYLKKYNAPGIYLEFKGEKTLLVGQVARYNLVSNYKDADLQGYLENFNKAWKSSVIFADLLQLLELYILVKEGISILDNEDLTKTIEHPKLNGIKKNEGFGIVEAPRGTLIHHYKTDNKMLLNEVELIIPTEINIPSINKVLTTNCKEFHERTQNMDKTKDLAQKILRCFDPCISCATH